MGRSLPRGTEPRAGRRAATRHVLLACCLVAAAPVGLFAQGTDNVRTYWVPTRNFRIPFSIGNDPYITAVLLHVSENGQGYRSAGDPVAVLLSAAALRVRVWSPAAFATRTPVAVAAAGLADPFVPVRRPGLSGRGPRVITPHG